MSKRLRDLLFVELPWGARLLAIFRHIDASTLKLFHLAMILVFVSLLFLSWMENLSNQKKLSWVQRGNLFFSKFQVALCRSQIGSKIYISPNVLGAYFLLCKWKLVRQLICLYYIAFLFYLDSLAFLYSNWFFIHLSSFIICHRYAREDTHYLLYIYDLMRIRLLSESPDPENSKALISEVRRVVEVLARTYVVH